MSWQAARNILCVRLDSIGDVLMTGPALRALKRSRTGRRLTLLTSPEGAAAASLMPEIDETMAFRAPWMKASAANEPQASLDLVEELRRRRFDAGIVFTTFSQSPLPAALILHLAGIPLRLAHCRENPYQLVSDWQPETDSLPYVRHEVRRQLDLVAAAGASTPDERLRICVSPPSKRAARAALASAGVELERPWLVLHPGASAPSRRYEHFAPVLASLLDRGLQVVLTGSREETDLVEELLACSGGGATSLAGRLDLATLAGVIEAAPLLLTNNTGPAHLAAATGTPVVVLYALTNRQHTPWLVPSRVLFHDVPCRDCLKSVCPLGHHDCLRLVKPAAVVAAVESLLAETRAPARAGP